MWNVADYVRLRTGGDDPALDEIAERGAFRGKRVLDLGCGPGRATRALAERHGARATGVDASAEMVAAARAHVPDDVEVVEARAEELPFADGAFDAVVAQFVVHLLDRPRAFAEARRVLCPGGAFFVKTEDPATMDGYWAVPLLPSYLAVERSRFPAVDVLERELRGAGFASVEIFHRTVPRELSRAEAIERLTSRAHSTFGLLPPGELEEGIRHAPDVLTDPVRYTLHLVIAIATRA
jgi:SAM-dependent methyltransferase